MIYPFDDGIDALELALLLAASEEMAEEELDRLREEAQLDLTGEDDT